MIQLIHHLTKDNPSRIRLIAVKLCCMLLLIFIAVGLYTDKAYASTGLKLYNYTTKKTTLYTNKQIKATLNGVSIGKKQTPGILVNGIALLPYNDIFQKSLIAANCVYDKENGTVSISKYDKTLKMTIGSKKATLNGKAVTLPVAPQKVKYVDINFVKILVPSRFVSETLGLGYNWNSSKSTVEITKNSLLLSCNGGDKFDYSGAQGKVSLDGKNISLGNMPSIIINNTALLRAKRVFSDSEIGADYNYSSSDQEITLSKNGNTLLMSIGSMTAYLNGNAVTLDTAPVVVKNYNVGSSYVMVPGSFTASCLGYDYQWNNSTRTSMITTQSITSSGSNDNGDADTFPELGDSGEITNEGVILSQWSANDTIYGKSSGIHELNTFSTTAAAPGVLASVTRDYSNVCLNSETFMFTSYGSFGKITSTSNNTELSIHAENMSCVDQAYQAYGVNSNFINTIGAYNNETNNSIRLELNLLSENYTYDLSLSFDGQILYVTIYYNTLTAAVIGTNNAGDYITLTGLSPISMSVSQSGGLFLIDLPYTTNSLGDINASFSSSKYVKLLYTISTSDRLQLALGLKDGYEYYSSVKGNQTTLLFLAPGSSSSSGGSVSNGSTSSGSTDTSDTVSSGSGQTVPANFNPGKYEIIIPKPSGITSSMISDEDNYFNKNFVLKITGDYTSSITRDNISNGSSAVTNIAVALNSSNETEITFYTSKLQGYQYVIDDAYIYINVGNPKEIYKNIVILDAGHGGKANGAVYFGTNEKDLNFKILYTIGKKYFNQDTSKLKVYYTRISDVDMSLSDRAAFANKYGADLFLSLHMNASLTKSVYGTEVYYSSNNNSPNSAGLTSSKLANIFADSITSSLGTKNRGSRSERYTVVHKNTVPAILLELGFLSNKSDYNILSDSAFQENAAKTIYETLLKVFAQYPTGR